MNHQFFEERLLSDEPLSKEEKDILDEHLSSCEACQQLARAWIQISTQLHYANHKEPQPGFTKKWQSRLNAKLEKQQKVKVIWLLSFYLLMAFVLTMILLLYFTPIIKLPLPYLFAFTIRITNWLSIFIAVFEFIRTFTGSIFRVVPATLWLGMGTALASLSVLWILTFRRLVYARRILV